MVVSFKSWVSRLLFILLFAVLLMIAAGGYRWLLDVVSPVHPYQKPRGDAMKVFEHDPTSPEKGNSADRLRWFYWYGE
ncbi:DUF4227 family protein [Paenibacillus sp. LHD-117]|uniref:DUF4227 family protein n=1 Tax=Paenibacillus sp. LHD-117 TaxID=3071412 RepID=UPI0027E011FC|nr:DUF4227 family protein [Paenibacillus sp. LHD-117]MDQ6421020.1 DUF4227 family protein [Paenibacillus sp. LHD-117]